MRLTSDNRQSGEPNSATDSALQKLMLNCCQLQPCQRALTDIALRIGDWSQLIDQGRHHLILPKIHSHLKALPSGAVPIEVLSELAAQNRKAVVRSLLHQSELRHLEREFLGPMNVQYLTLKGLTLAQRYYGDILQRQSRDIDLLVDPASLFDLTAQLISHGYRLIEQDSVDSPEALRAYCVMHGEVNLISQRGVLVQLHQLLDFTGCQYPVQFHGLFEIADTVVINGDHYRVLPTVELFLYISYHHSRHRWSRLHWLSDLDAIISHASFDLPVIVKRAKALGMLPIVQAALDLHAALLRPMSFRQEPRRFSKALIADALLYSRPKTKPPEMVREEQRRNGVGTMRNWGKEFSYNWRANTLWKNRVRYLLFIAKPTYADYLFFPLPTRLAGLHILLRPVRWLHEILFGKAKGATKSA